MVLERVMRMLEACGTSKTVLPPTELYNEGWMLRLVLDWFDHNRGADHPFALKPGARWYSEARLASQFLAESRGDPRSESFTHADGVVGHFTTRVGKRSEAALEADAQQFVVLEAKLGSVLSSGVKNAPGYDQAARNVACMAHMLSEGDTPAEKVPRLGFYVVAPESRIEEGVFGDLVSEESIRAKVRRRAAQYHGAKDAWVDDWFEPLIHRVQLGLVSWESVLAVTGDPELDEFYQGCKGFNL